MVVRRFKFEDPRIEQIQDLENDMMKYLREDLHRRLLSADFKKQVDGLEMLQKALPSIAKDVIEVLDILLRWFMLQFCKSNTTCLLKVLEILPELLDTLKDEGYSLTESEVSIFLPCLIEKGALCLARSLKVDDGAFAIAQALKSNDDVAVTSLNKRLLEYKRLLSHLFICISSYSPLTCIVDLEYVEMIFFVVFNLGMLTF